MFQILEDSKLVGGNDEAQSVVEELSKVTRREWKYVPSLHEFQLKSVGPDTLIVVKQRTPTISLFSSHYELLRRDVRTIELRKYFDELPSVTATIPPDTGEKGIAVWLKLEIKPASLSDSFENVVAVVKELYCRISSMELGSGNESISTCNHKSSCRNSIKKETLTWRELRLNKDFELCYDGELKDQIVTILAKDVFGEATRSILQNRYDRIKECFRDAAYDSERWNQDGGLGNLLEQSHDRNAAVLDVPADKFEGGWSAVLSKYHNCGHDMPVWMRIGKKTLPRVLIIGQDPQRKDHEYKGHLYLSTPWGCHSASFNGGACASARNLFASIMQECGCELYVTDYSKLYFTQSIHGDGTSPNLNDRISEQESLIRGIGGSKSLVDVLLSEVKLYKPDLIVTFGAWVDNVSSADHKWDISFDRLLQARRSNVFEKPYLTLYHPNARWTQLEKCIGMTQTEYFGAVIAEIKQLLWRKAADRDKL